MNLLDHLTEILSNKAGAIGLVTYQNGILNLSEDFNIMEELILKKVPPGPLFIGLYNRTYGITGDLGRLFDALKGYDSESICFTRLMFGTLAKLLPRINSELLWHHIAHSEGGLIASLAIQGHRIEQQDYIKKHLIVTAYGPVAPISKKITHTAWNIYSQDDKAALRFGKAHLNHLDYEIQIVRSLIPKEKQPPVEGDHAFKNETYQEALRANILTLKTRGIYYA